jgi:hypothetical protein
MPNGADHRIPREILETARQASRRRKMYPLLSRIYFVLVTVALLDFIFLIALSFYIGGDAVNGKIENGKCLVWGYNHHNGTKGYTEVSRPVYDFSKWQVYSVLATWSVMLLGAALYKRLPSGD